MSSSQLYSISFRTVLGEIYNIFCGINDTVAVIKEKLRDAGMKVPEGHELKLILEGRALEDDEKAVLEMTRATIVHAVTLRCAPSVSREARVMGAAAPEGKSPEPGAGPKPA